MFVGVEGVRRTDLPALERWPLLGSAGSRECFVVFACGLLSPPSPVGVEEKEYGDCQKARRRKREESTVICTYSRRATLQATLEPLSGYVPLRRLNLCPSG